VVTEKQAEQQKAKQTEHKRVEAAKNIGNKTLQDNSNTQNKNIHRQLEPELGEKK
jgi:hypothetical protein